MSSYLDGANSYFLMQNNAVPVPVNSMTQTFTHIYSLTISRDMLMLLMLETDLHRRSWLGSGILRAHLSFHHAHTFE